jgi:hypothetical protein
MKKILLYAAEIVVVSLLVRPVTAFDADCQDFIQSNSYSCEFRSEFQNEDTGTFSSVLQGR